jgi:hypothetical protein
MRDEGGKHRRRSYKKNEQASRTVTETFVAEPIG